MVSDLYNALSKKLNESFSKKWDPELDLSWGLDNDTHTDAQLAGSLYIESVDIRGERKRIHEIKGKANTEEELNDWIAELLSIVLHKHPVWRVSKTRKK